jgi:hypothetical protein
MSALRIANPKEVGPTARSRADAMPGTKSSHEWQCPTYSSSSKFSHVNLLTLSAKLARSFLHPHGRDLTETGFKYLWIQYIGNFNIFFRHDYANDLSILDISLRFLAAIYGRCAYNLTERLPSRTSTYMKVGGTASRGHSSKPAALILWLCLLGWIRNHGTQAVWERWVIEIVAAFRSANS